jgi:hypothetical protein
MANEAPPGFEPASVPERLRVLEGRTAYIKIPPLDEAPLYAAQGAVLMGNVPAQVVTPANTTSIPIELALREREFDRFVQGYVSEADLVAFMDKQSSAAIRTSTIGCAASVRTARASAPSISLLNSESQVRRYGPRFCGFYPPRILHITYEHEKCLCRNGRRFVHPAGRCPL